MKAPALSLSLFLPFVKVEHTIEVIPLHSSLPFPFPCHPVRPSVCPSVSACSRLAWMVAQKRNANEEMRKQNGDQRQRLIILRAGFGLRLRNFHHLWFPANEHG